MTRLHLGGEHASSAQRQSFVEKLCKRIGKPEGVTLHTLVEDKETLTSHVEAVVHPVRDKGWMERAEKEAACVWDEVKKARSK